MFLGQFTTSLPILYKTSTKWLPSLLSPLNLNLEFIRGRKRGRRKPSKAERLARLQRKEKKDAEKLEESQKRRLEELKKTFVFYFFGDLELVLGGGPSFLR